MSRRALAIPSGGGLPKIVGASTVTTYANSATASVPTPVGVASGDLMLTVIRLSGVLASSAAGWTRLTIPGGSVVQVWAKYASGSEPSSYNWAAPAGEYINCAVVAVRGLPGLPIASMANVIGTLGGSGGSAVTSATATSVAPTATSWLLYYSFQANDNYGYTAGPAGMDSFIVPGFFTGSVNRQSACIAGSTATSPSGVATGDRTATMTGGGHYSGLIAFTL